MNDELYQRYLSEGERVIYEEKKASWEALLNARRANLAQDQVIQYVIPTMNALGGAVSKADIQAVVDFFPYKPPYEELPKEAMENVRRIVLTYAKHGPEFFEATQIGEMDEQLKKYVEKIKEENKKYQERENEKFKKVEEKPSPEMLLRRCEKIIYPERIEEWRKNLTRRMKSPTKGKEILPALEIMCSLEDGKSMDEVMALFNSYNLSRKDALPVEFIILDFSKRGPEFYEAINRDNMNAQVRQFIAKKQAENEALAKLHETSTKAPVVEEKVQEPKVEPVVTPEEEKPVSQEEPKEEVKKEDAPAEVQEAPVTPQEAPTPKQEEIPLTDHEKNLAVTFYKSLQDHTFEDLLRTLPLSDKSLLYENIEQYAKWGNALLQEGNKAKETPAPVREVQEAALPQEETKVKEETKPVEPEPATQNKDVVPEPKEPEIPVQPEEPKVEPKEEAKEESTPVATPQESPYANMDLPPEEKRFLEAVERFKAIQKNDRLTAQINSLVDAMAQEDTIVDDKESHMGK